MKPEEQKTTTVLKQAVDRVPLHSGSDVYISTKDLIRIYTPKPALYTSRLVELIFGREVLLNACVTRTSNTGHLKPLEEKTLRSVIGKLE